jgi:hypothetical protein
MYAVLDEQLASSQLQKSETFAAARCGGTNNSTAQMINDNAS